jgi:DNA-binding NtrC family response regulator
MSQRSFAASFALKPTFTAPVYAARFEHAVWRQSGVATLQGDRMLLLVDSADAHARFVSSLAARGGWRMIVARDTERAVATLGTHEGLLIDAVLIDERAAADNLASTIAAMRDWRPQLPIIFLGDPLNRRAALAAIGFGATDFLERPLTAERLHMALDHAIAPRQSEELRPLSEKFPAPLAIEEIIGSSPAFRTALAIAAKAARARVPMLIEGERGTGKALLAAAIHEAGGRVRAPLIEVDCAHHADSMIGPVLFGHEQGAFAGAFDRRVGAFVQAHGGTLVLDRVERLPAEVQRQLVAVLATGQVQALGATQVDQVDVRVIACSTMPLKQRIAEGGFREDLLAQLGVVEITLPPLRDRRSDVPALARHLLARIAMLPGMGSVSLSAEASDALSRFAWPGNVRQLHDALIRAATRAHGGQLTLADFPGLQAERARSPGDSFGPAAAEGIGITLYRADGNLRALQDIEADVIRLAIGHYRGRMSEVARRLGIGRSTLYRKLADLGIDTAA